MYKQCRKINLFFSFQYEIKLNDYNKQYCLHDLFKLFISWCMSWQFKWSSMIASFNVFCLVFGITHCFYLNALPVSSFYISCHMCCYYYDFIFIPHTHAHTCTLDNCGSALLSVFYYFIIFTISSVQHMLFFSHCLIIDF